MLFKKFFVLAFSLPLNFKGFEIVVSLAKVINILLLGNLKHTLVNFKHTINKSWAILYLQICRMNIHIGQKIKARAGELRIGPTELGKLINTSKQNIYGIFKRKSIDTELLYKISQVLNYDFFQLYSPIETELLTTAKAILLKGKKSLPIKTIIKLLKALEDCKKENEKLKKDFAVKEVGYLKKINELLERKERK